MSWLNRRRRRSRCAHGVVLVSLTALGAVGTLAAPLSTMPPGSAGAASAVPYTDPSAVGSIGLCNQAGQQITSGSITTRPFAWRAVSTQAAPAPYNNAGRTATLVVYLPELGLPAGDWSGTEMTASSSYTNPANPMAAATDADESLQSVVEEFPPKWDGFLELRMYLDTANTEPYEQEYPTLNIQVTGDMWQAVGGSPVNCASGTAESFESVVLPSTTTTTTPSSAKAQSTTATTVTAASAGSTSGGGSSGAGSGAAGDNGGSRAPEAAGRSVGADPTGQTNVAPIVLVGIALLVVLAALLYLLRRRRLASHASGLGPEPPLYTSSSTKGDSQ